jgi:hypothetical protein
MHSPRKNYRPDINFETLSQSDLPNGRRGKHHQLILHVLDDLEQLGDGRAIKVPLADFEGTVADIRSAILRATKKKNLKISTSSDDEFFYLWKAGTNGDGRK